MSTQHSNRFDGLVDEGKRLVREPARRTALLGALLAVAIGLTGIAGRASAPGEANVGDKASTGERGADGSSVDPTIPTVTMGSTSSTSPPTTQQILTPTRPTTTPVDSEPTIVVEPTPAALSFEPVLIGDCPEPALASGRVAVVATSCSLPGELAASVTDELQLIVLWPDTPLRTIDAAAQGDDAGWPTLAWSPDAGVLRSTSDAPAGANRGTAPVGWLPCDAGDDCTVTARPDLLPSIALGKLAFDGAPEGLDRDACPLTLRGLATAIDLEASAAVFRCHRGAAPIVGADQDGCVAAPVPSTVPVDAAGPYGIRLLDIGFGADDDFRSLVTMPAPRRICLDQSYAPNDLRFRWRTALTADRPVPGLLWLLETEAAPTPPLVTEVETGLDPARPADPTGQTTRRLS